MFLKNHQSAIYVIGHSRSKSKSVSYKILLNIKENHLCICTCLRFAHCFCNFIHLDLLLPHGKKMGKLKKNVLTIHSFVNYIFTFSPFFVSRGNCLKMISDLSNFISSVVVYNVSMRHQQVLKEKLHLYDRHYHVFLE